MERVIEPEEVLETLTGRGEWFFSPFVAANRLDKGDRILFYLSGKQGGRAFAGQAECASAPTAPSTNDQALLRNWGVGYFTRKVELQDVRQWSVRIPLKSIVNDLDFIKNKHYYGLNLRQGIVRVSDHDYQLVLSFLPRSEE